MQAVASALHAEEKETAALWRLNSALREAEFGNDERARQEANEGLRLASTRDVKTLAAVALACAGDKSHARLLVDGLQEEFPMHTTLNHYWLPVIRAYLELRSHHPIHAVQLLEEVVP